MLHNNPVGTNFFRHLGLNCLLYIIVSFYEYCVLYCEHIKHGLYVCLARLGYQALHEYLGRVEAQLLQPVREEVRLDLLDL